MIYLLAVGRSTILPAVLGVLARGGDGKLGPKAKALPCQSCAVVMGLATVGVFYPLSGCVYTEPPLKTMTG